MGGDLSAGVKLLWSSGRSVRLLLGTIVAIQVLVPLVALGDPPARFGFQMYSGIGGAMIIAVDGDGDSIELDHEKIVAGGLRPDLPWVERLPEAVCERVPAAAEVTVIQGSEARTVLCKD